MSTEKNTVGVFGVHLSNNITGRKFRVVPKGNLARLFLNLSAEALKLLNKVLPA
jgi:hypothetical protein